MQQFNLGAESIGGFNQKIAMKETAANLKFHDVFMFIAKDVMLLPFITISVELELLDFTVFLAQ